uniref:Gamma-aminobutyric acid (GABA) B receptor, 1 n=1 Tax=Iconisemion striatum TaxID=60296 RepID=A0A1A7WN33_9TELE
MAWFLFLIVLSALPGLVVPIHNSSSGGCAIIRPPRDGGIRYRGLTQEQVLIISPVVLLVPSAPVSAGLDVSGERPRGGEASRTAGGGDGSALQLQRRLHPGGEEQQPLHQAGEMGRSQTHLPL